jgi:hypothetical protein
MRLTSFPSSAGRSKQYEQTQLMSGMGEVDEKDEEERGRSRAAETISSSSKEPPLLAAKAKQTNPSKANSLPTSLSYIYTLFRSSHGKGC